jgi:hypothetical protein
MKKLVFLLAAFCLLSLSAYAQKATDFSGEWSLDKSKSTLSDRMKNLESMTLTVAQTDKELKVTSSAKRGAPPAGAPAGPPPGSGGGGGRGMGAGGGMMGGDQTMTYSLDGKETSAEVPGPGGTNSTAKLTAKTDSGKLHLSSTRTFNTQMGEVTTTTKETWELQADGSLKVKRDTESPRGTDSNEMVFTKKTK